MPRASIVWCVTIVALSDIGEVTARLLDFNNSDRLLERQVLRDGSFSQGLWGPSALVKASPAERE